MNSLCRSSSGLPVGGVGFYALKASGWTILGEMQWLLSLSPQSSQRLRHVVRHVVVIHVVILQTLSIIRTPTPIASSKGSTAEGFCCWTSVPEDCITED